MSRGTKPVPSLVAFHTWSADDRQDETPYALWCVARLGSNALPFPRYIDTAIHAGHTGSVPVGRLIRRSRR